MKYKEVRTGNYVNLYGTVANIEPEDFGGNGIAITDGKPILINEEWLKAFGFKKFLGSGQLFDKDDFWACRLIDYGFLRIEHLEVSLEYVHQLQNLYYALTKKDLQT